MSTINKYENLYKNMQKHFTVEKDGDTYTLGAYMRKRANETKAEQNLPVAIKENSGAALRSIVTYVGEKLTVKRAPATEKTMRAFPMRTSLAACLSAVLICTLMFSYALLQSPAAPGGSYVAESAEQTDEPTVYVAANTER